MFLSWGILAFSVNYFIAEDEITVEDSDNTLGIYNDANTAGGYVIQVGLDRHNNQMETVQSNQY